MIVQDEVSFVKVKNGSDGSDGTDGKDGSNGKDGANGKDSNMHTAYSWSADGTDRFTPTYPNENLLVKKNTDDKKYLREDGVEVVEMSWSITDYILVDKDDVLIVFGYSNLGFNPSACFYDSNKKFLSGIKANGNSATANLKVPQNAKFVRYSILSSDLQNKVKIEKSLEPTIYTPSPQDDFNNAWPTYSGTYSSHDKVQSQNPKDYTWARIRGADGLDGKDGQTPKDVISGYLSNEAIIVPATPTGAVTDYSKAFGDFIVSEGQTKLVNGVTYSKVSEVNMTSTINSAGRYAVTALSADTGTATYRATYAGVTVDKILIVVKNKQGETGNNGVGVSSTAITYQVGNSGTTTPTGSWSSTIPSVAENQFLWTRTITTYTNNTTSTGYSVSKIGGTGNTGNGVKNSATAYVGSTSGTTIPTSGWTSSIPTVAEGSYLWTRTILTFTDNTTNTSYSVAKQGAQGNTGPKGDPTGITVSPTVPTNPYINMLWQNTGSSNGYLTGTVYQWNGVKWNIFIFSAENIVATTLSAISTKTGELDVTGDITLQTDNTVIKGSYDYGDNFGQAYYDRWFDGIFEVGRRFLKYLGNVYQVNPNNTKGNHICYAESYYGLDYFKMREYISESNRKLLGRVDIHGQAIQLSDSWGAATVGIQSNGLIYTKILSVDRIASHDSRAIQIGGEISALSEINVAESNIYFNQGRSELADFRVGKDGSSLAGGRVIKSESMYDRTYSSAANVVITSDGVLGRSTSARKYKTDIKIAEEVIKNAKRVLNINPSSWIDKGDLSDGIENKRYHGFIADEFDEAGLKEVVVYGANGQIESLAYDRIPIYHNVILKEQEKEIADLNRRIKRLENQLELVMSKL